MDSPQTPDDPTVVVPNTDPINPTSMETMTEDEIIAFTQAVRDARLAAVRAYELEMAEARAVKEARLTKKLTKDYELLGKEVLRATRCIEALEKRLMRIRVGRFDLGLDDTVTHASHLTVKEALIRCSDTKTSITSSAPEDSKEE
jgi:predicted component of viral defense system (DUF524 family)